MQITVQKWGNSAALRLSKSLLQELHAAIGDTVEAEIRDGGIFLKPAEKREFTLDELLSTCTRANTRPNDEDRQWLNNEPNGKEVI